MLGRLMLVLTLVAASGLARADPEVEAWELMQKGEQLFRGGDFSGARETILRAVQLVSRRVPTMDRWLGLADAHLDRCRDAVAELDRYLGSSPSDTLAISEATAERDRCRALIASRGHVRIVTSPAGAEIRLDTKDANTPPLGSTPFESDSVPLGDHLVQVSRPGYEPMSRLVSVAAGKTTSLDMQLWQLPDFAAPAPLRRPVWRRKWFWPVVAASTLVAIGVAVGVGVGVGLHAQPTYPVLVFK